jgi:hypothetical protein
MSRMSELHANAAVVLSDPAFDTYRLECIVTDLRGHHPDDLDEERIYKCVQALIKIMCAGKEVA